MSQLEKWIREYLERFPIHLAFIRPLELSLFRPLSFDPPVLDLGCGNGYFSRSLSLPFPDVFGLDPNPGFLRESKSLGSFRGVAQAKGESMPFRSGQFGTVLCNSSLEHMEGLNAILSEVHRILRPKGRFYFTVPGRRFGELLFGFDLLRRLGFSEFSKWYSDWFIRHSKIVHLYDKPTWREILVGHSFSVQICDDYFSPTAMRAFDLSHYVGIFSLPTRWLFGRWRLIRGKWDWIPLARYILDTIRSESAEEGAFYFFACTK